MENVQESQAPVASYDLNKSYKWSPEDPFVISGGEFSVLLNALRAVLSSQEAQRILLASRANDVVESVFARSVELGIAKEVVEEQSEQQNGL
jgi:hypothetical protein